MFLNTFFGLERGPAESKAFGRPVGSQTSFELQGTFEIASNNRIAGWVWDKRRPVERLGIVVRLRGEHLAEIKAALYRKDLQQAGIGDGCYAFDLHLGRPLPDEALEFVTVEVTRDGAFLIPRAPDAVRASSERRPVPSLKDCQVNVWNVAQLRSRPPAVFGQIRFDPNNTCNLRCVYCHNPRSDGVVDSDAFRAFLHENVLAADNFQVGCIMEPTLDQRLAELMLMVAHSPAKPTRGFMLQTNGILLHRHDHAKMAEAGLTELSVSLDAAEPDTQRFLRSGTSLDKVVRNVAGFRQACPDIDVTFITTVTKKNIQKLEPILELGIGLGVANFVFREVFYFRDNPVVDHAQMPDLVLGETEFADVMQSLIASHGTRARMVFADSRDLAASSEKMTADSWGPGPDAVPGC